MADKKFQHETPDPDHLPMLDRSRVRDFGPFETRPRILLLYGSLRPGSYSRAVVEEAARLLTAFGADTRVFDPAGLPLPDAPDADSHPAVMALRDGVGWSEAQFWCSPERHGQVAAVLKLQIDHIPRLADGACPTAGKPLAVAQVSGGVHSFNAVNAMRHIGRWMQMPVITTQLSIPAARLVFDDRGRLTDAAYYERLVDVVEQLIDEVMAVRARSRSQPYSARAGQSA